MAAQSVALASGLAARLAELTKPVPEIEEAFLASAMYDGDLRLAVLKLYDPKARRFWLWRDNTGHRPYCLTRLPMEELAAVRARKDVIDIVEEEKLDLLGDDRAKLRKIVTTDPLAIGGGNDSIRDMIRAWEADIKYYENYAYDRGLRMGTYYSVRGGKVVPVKHDVPERVSRSLEEVTRRNPKEFQPYLKEWAELLSEPLCEFRRVALDIEVANEAGRLPDAEDPKQPVIAVSFFNEEEKTVFVLGGGKDTAGLRDEKFESRVFESEAELLREVMGKVMEYPVIVTFNGDDFDLRYLKHRADALGIGEGENPIQLERVAASLKHGIHIDLYQFFRNRSIQVYAFGNKYTEHTLNAIAETLLNKSKIEFEGEVGDLPLAELARYCLNDAQLTYELTSMSGSLVMKLLQVISRIGKMPMNDVSRLGVSNWIRSMLFFEHRKMGALIPRQDELSEKGGASSQSIIKGKKYKGGFVIEPKPGAYFDVSVLDFASLVFDESIFVRKRQTNQIYKTRIGEFVEGRLPHGKGFAAREIGPTWDVLSFDYHNQGASWKTITAVIRHPNQPEVLELVTESGRRVRITEGHSVIALDSEGRKKTVRGRDLKAGDYLIALSSFSAPQSDSRLDLLPFLRQLREYDITRGARGHGSTVILRSRRSRRKLVLPRYVMLTPEMMWGLGYWLAEGWNSRSGYGESLQVEASTKDVELAESKLAAAGFDTWVSPSKTEGCSRLGIGKLMGTNGNLPATIVAKVVALWFGDRARVKKVPDWVMRLPLRMKEAFVDGYYRGDGYKPTEHGRFVVNGKYKVGSYSQVLVDDLMSLELMSGLHCFSKVHARPESFLTWSRGEETYRGTKRPPPELLARSEHVQEFAETPFYRSHRTSPIRYERVNRASVKEYKAAFRNFYNGNCHFEKIKEIQTVKNDLPVYDISVRGSESFFNADGLLLSNSLYPSLIKVHNLSYETVNCTHPECRTNTVPDTSSWVCTKKKGIVSLVTGSLRDLRVAHYKPLTKDPTLGKEERELYNVVSQGLKVYLNACFTGDTYIVTPDGIRNIKDVRVGDEVVNVNPLTLMAEVDKVVEVQAFQYNGSLIHFDDRRFVDLMVTPNHRMLTVDRSGSSASHTTFRTADEVCHLSNITIPKLKGGVKRDPALSRISLLAAAGQVGGNANFYPEKGVRLINWFRRLPTRQQELIRQHGKVHKYRNRKRNRLDSHYVIPAVHVNEEDVDAAEAAGGRVLVGEKRSAKIPARFDQVDFASLCGWFVSEGYPHVTLPKQYANGNLRGRSASITISQGQGRGNPRGLEFRGEIRGLLDKLGLPHVQDSGDNKYYQITSSVLHKWMVGNCYVEGSKQHDASTKAIPRFVFDSSESMKAFLDAAYKGDGNQRQTRYTTASVKLAQDLVVLTTMLGMKAKMIYDNGVYRLVFKNVSSKLTHSGKAMTKNLGSVPFNGTVYCVTTEKNHTVIAGRNGRFVQVGQSYGVLGFETFAFYCLPVAEATAALGRDAITRTIAKCKELGIEVLYGDSVTGERCVALLDPKGMFQIMPIKDFFSKVGKYQTREDGKDEAYPGPWKALSVNPATGRVDFKPVLAVVRHRNRKKIFRVRERWGVTRVTEDHSLLARTNEGLAFAKPNEMVGKETVRVSGIPQLRQVDEIDLYEEVKNVTFTSIYKGRTKISTAKCDDEWVWFSWTNRSDPIKLKRKIRIGTPEFEALLDLVAAYVPEGSSSTPETASTRIGASIANSDTEWLQHLGEGYLRLFSGAKVSIIRSDRGERHLTYATRSGLVETVYEDKTFKLQMMNQISAVLFKALGGQGSKEKKIPSFVFHLSASYKQRFLSGLIKGDGSKWPDKRYSKEYIGKNFRYESASLQLISGLSLILTSLGTNHIVNYRPSKDTYIITTSSAYNSRNTLKITEEEYDGYVYDLTVADYHTFVDACGGLVLKNTDSLFLRSPSREQIATVTRWADTDLGVELDLDKVYRYVAFSSRKKNYFGVLPDGSSDIRGLTGKKSVDGKTPMLARFDDKVQLTTVEDVYRAFKAGKNVQAVTVADGLNTAWVNVSDASQHKVDEVYRVKTSKGRELTLSGDHSVYLIDTHGSLYHRETRYLQPGEVVVGSQYIPPGSPASTLPVLHYLTSPVRLSDGMARPARLHATTGAPIPVKLPLNHALATLLGLYVTEGCTSQDRRSRNNSISLNRILNPEVCAAIERAWPTIFMMPVKVYRRAKGQNSYHLPRLHAEFFGHLCGGSSAVKHVPGIVFDADDDFVAAFLHAVFSADGYGDGKKVNIASKSKELLTGIAYLLARFDIDVRIRRFSVKGRPYHQLSVVGAFSRDRFYQFIGFMQRRFTGRVGTGPRNKELIPITTAGLLSVKNDIARRRGLKAPEGVDFHDLRYYNLSRLDHYNAVIGSLLQQATAPERNRLVAIARMLNVRDVSYDRIVSVRKLRGSAVMYDFTIPTFERFVAGNIPTLLHNSQTPEYLKETFYDALGILSEVKTPEDFERARTSIRELLTKMISDLKGKKIPVEGLAFNVMMGKETQKYNGTTPQHVRAAKLLEERGQEIKAGEIISYVKTKYPPYVKPAKLAKVDEVDADKYIEYAHSMFDQMLDALDFSFDEIMGATTLDFFWSG